MKQWISENIGLKIAVTILLMIFITTYLEEILYFIGVNSEYIKAILTGITSSLVVTFVFHHFVSKKLSKSLLEDVAEKTSKTAIDYATNKIFDNSKKVLPVKTYPRSNKPIEDFKNDFSLSLKQSKIYFFKGGVGMYTAYRLDRLKDNAQFKDKEIGMIILHPKSTEQLEAKAKFKYKNSIHPIENKDIQKFITESQSKIFQVLVALFDVRDSLTVSLCFHSGDVIFREEIFDDSIYVSYYLGGDFPGTYKYLPDSYIYEAYQHNFRLSFSAFKDGIKFDETLDETQFKEILVGLGFNGDISSCRKEYAERFKQFDENNPFINETVF